LRRQPSHLLRSGWRRQQRSKDNQLFHGPVPVSD
jgi:hypothetical protein